PSDPTRALYDALPYAGRGRRPRLRVASPLRRPVLVGFFRPAILIPPAMDWPGARERLRLSLLHELAHAERADSRFGLAGSLAQATWFFIPWAWWIRHQMRLDQEFLADRCASFGFGPFSDYASSLVDLADPGPSRQATGPAPASRPSTLWGAGSALFQRILM